MRKLILNIALLLLTANLFSQYWYVFENEDTLHYDGGNVSVSCMYPDGDSILYVGGFFKHGGSTLLYCIGAWNGDNWDPLYLGLFHTDIVKSVYKFNNNIYIGGNFFHVNYVPNTKYIAKWDGTNWSGLNNSYGELSGDPRSMVSYNNNLVFTGFVGLIGSTFFNDIVGYNESNYFQLGGLPDTGFKVEVYDGELYAIGLWPSIEKYNDSLNSWEMVGGYVNDYPDDMKVDTFNNFLYVSGGFTIVDDTIHTDNVAIWDGFKWSKVGYGNGNPSVAYSIELYRGDVYAGLWTDQIGGVFTGHLARWDGTDWHMVGDSVGWAVHDMVIYRDTLYVGGTVAYEPYDETRGVLAKWYMPPDTTCKYLKPRVQTYTDTFYMVSGEAEVQFYNNNAYVQTWSWDFGDTTTDNVKDPSHIYTDTGIYNVCVTVNDTGCVKTACKDIVVVLGTGMSEINTEEIGFKLYPNPTTNTLFVEMTPKSPKGDLKNKNLQIIDVKGKVVLSTSLKHTVIASNEVVRQSVDISDLPNGVYFVKIGKHTKKFVKE